jgi:hypothetical protein
MRASSRVPGVGQGDLRDTDTNGSAHTPGPWKFDQQSGRVFAGAPPLCVAFVIGGLDDEPGIGPTSCANARLIVATPDLVDALAALTAACEMDFECEAEDDEHVGGGDDGPMALTFGMIRRARAALDKASVDGRAVHTVDEGKATGSAPDPSSSLVPPQGTR